MIKPISWLAALLTSACLSGVFAGEADVVKVQVSKEGSGSYRFDVTVRHADEGWTHYANKWEVVAPDGRVLATRTLLHPHENEQPFTRSLAGVKIPEAIGTVKIRAADSKHGAGGAEIEVKLPR
jgi:hypothetical protein